MDRIDIDDAWLADKLPVEINGYRRERLHGRIDLRLNEGYRNRPLRVLRSMCRSKPEWRADRVRNPTLFEVKAGCDPSISAGISSRRFGWSLRQPICHRLRPVAVPAEALVVLADEGSKAGREQVERHLCPIRRTSSASSATSTLSARKRRKR